MGQTSRRYIRTTDDGDGCGTTAAGSAAVAVQTVVGGPVRIHVAGKAGSAGEKHCHREKDVYICHVGAILDVSSTELPV